MSKLGEFDASHIEHFLAHRNPIRIFDIVRDDKNAIVKFSIEFDDGIILKPKKLDGSNVEEEYLLFIELMQLRKKQKTDIVKN